MKYLLPFAACALQCILAQNTYPNMYDRPTGLGPQNTKGGKPAVDTKAIEDKIKAELVMQIGQFDFDNAIKGVAKENQIDIEKRYTTTEADIHKTLEDLSTLLRDRGVLASMWPSAEVDDPELYSHLNIKIDQHLSKIELFTAASSPDGTPLRLKVYDI